MYFVHITNRSKLFIDIALNADDQLCIITFLSSVFYDCFYGLFILKVLNVQTRFLNHYFSLYLSTKSVTKIVGISLTYCLPSRMVCNNRSGSSTIQRNSSCFYLNGGTWSLVIYHFLPITLK